MLLDVTIQLPGYILVGVAVAAFAYVGTFICTYRRIILGDFDYLTAHTKIYILEHFLAIQV